MTSPKRNDNGENIILPVTSKGKLGALKPKHSVSFNTTDGSYILEGEHYQGGRQIQVADDSPLGLSTRLVFDFTDIEISSDVKVTAGGTGPLILLAKGNAELRLTETCRRWSIAGWPHGP